MKAKIRTILFWILLGLVFLLSVIIKSATNWFDIRFGVSFEEVLFTITSPLAGSDVSFLDEALEYIMPSIVDSLKQLITPALCAVFLYFIFIQLKICIGNIKIKIDLYRLYQFTYLGIVLVLLVNSLSFGVKTLGIDTYIARKLDKTSIYEDYYVDPNSVEITNNGSNRNLLYIYLESMETTYASTDIGGSQETNYIPNLTMLAEEK